MKVRRLRWRFYRKTGGPLGIGPRCKDYGPGCMICESYRFYDEHGRFPSFEEVRAISDEILGNAPSGVPMKSAAELFDRLGLLQDAETRCDADSEVAAEQRRSLLAGEWDWSKVATPPGCPPGLTDDAHDCAAGKIAPDEAEGPA